MERSAHKIHLPGDGGCDVCSVGVVDPCLQESAFAVALPLQVLRRAAKRLSCLFGRQPQRNALRPTAGPLWRRCTGGSSGTTRPSVAPPQVGGIAP